MRVGDLANVQIGKERNGNKRTGNNYTRTKRNADILTRYGRTNEHAERNETNGNKRTGDNWELAECKNAKRVWTNE